MSNEREIVKYRIELKENCGSFNSEAIAYSVQGRVIGLSNYFDGTKYTFIIECPLENCVYLESILENDDNCINFMPYFIYLK